MERIAIIDEPADQGDSPHRTPEQFPTPSIDTIFAYLRGVAVPASAEMEQDPHANPHGCVYDNLMQAHDSTVFWQKDFKSEDGIDECVGVRYSAPPDASGEPAFVMTFGVTHRKTHEQDQFLLHVPTSTDPAFQLEFSGITNQPLLALITNFLRGAGPSLEACDELSLEQYCQPAEDR